MGPRIRIVLLCLEEQLNFKRSHVLMLNIAQDLHQNCFKLFLPRRNQSPDTFRQV